MSVPFTKSHLAQIASGEFGHTELCRQLAAYALAEAERADRATIRRDSALLVLSMRDSQEWLCAACNEVHPTRVLGSILQTCPRCGELMTPTSVGARRISELQKELEYERAHHVRALKRERLVAKVEAYGDANCGCVSIQGPACRTCSGFAKNSAALAALDKEPQP